MEAALRIILVGLALGWAGPRATPQVPQEPTPPLVKGEKNEDDWQQTKEENGHVRESGWRVHATYEVIDLGPDPKLNPKTIVCANHCVKAVHDGHEKCNFDCDVKCAGKHKVKLEPFMFKPWKEIAAAKQKMKGDIGGYGSGYVDFWEIWQEIVDKVDNPMNKLGTFEENIPCWNDNPCSTKTRVYGYRKCEIRVAYRNQSISREYSKDDKEGQSKAEIKVEDMWDSDHTVSLGFIWLPVREPIVRSFETVFCLCEKKPVEKTQTGLPPATDPKTGTTEKPMSSCPETGQLKMCTDPNADGKKCQPEEPKDGKGHSMRVIGKDLNASVVTCSNNLDVPLEVFIEPGCRLVPKDKVYQTMVVVRFYAALIPPKESRTFEVRTACTEMTKKQPDENCVYRLEDSNDPQLDSIAAFVAGERFRGPWDQALVWIYTEGLPREEINKHLIPGVSEGAYVRALRECAQLTDLDMTGRRWDGCFDPSLLAGYSAQEQDTSWFVAQLMKRKPGAARRFVDEQRFTFVEQMGGENAKFAAEHALDLATALCAGSSEDRRAAFGLVAAVPEAQREAAAASGAALAAESALLSGNDAESESAIEVVKALALKDAVPNLRKVVRGSGGPAVRAKAQQALDRLQSQP